MAYTGPACECSLDVSMVRELLVPPLAGLFLRGNGGGDGVRTDNGQKCILNGIIDSQATKGDATTLAIDASGCGAFDGVCRNSSASTDSAVRLTEG